MSKFLIYNPKPRDFKERRDTTQFFQQLPILLQLFNLFWPIFFRAPINSIGMGL